MSNEEPKADRSGWKTLTEVIILLETGRLSLLQTIFEIVWEVVECGGKGGNEYPTPQTLHSVACNIGCSSIGPVSIDYVTKKEGLFKICTLNDDKFIAINFLLNMKILM